MKNDISSYWESKDGYMMPVFVQNPYRPEQLIEKYKLTEIKYEEEEKMFKEMTEEDDGE